MKKPPLLKALPCDGMWLQFTASRLFSALTVASILGLGGLAGIGHCGISSAFGQTQPLPTSDPIPAHWGRPDDVHISYHHNPADSGMLEGPFLARVAGRKWLEGQFAGGRKEGRWRTHHLQTEAVLSEGWFAGGRPEGNWVYRYPDGRRRAECEFAAGRPVGVWQSFHARLGDDERVWAKWTDDHLHLTSPNGDSLLSRELMDPTLMQERVFSSAGTLLAERTLRWQTAPPAEKPIAGQHWPSGFDPAQQPRMRLLLAVPPEHLFVQWTDEALAAGGRWIRWGSFRRYSAMGAMMEHTVWHGDTLLQVVKLAADAFGRREGDVTGQGQPASEGWSPLTGSGQIQHRHITGSIAEQAQYLHNLRHGPTVLFMPNGRKQIEGQYLQGRPTGTWLAYEVTGRLEMRATVDASDESGACWTVETIGLNGATTDCYRSCNGRLEGKAVRYDTYGDTTQILSWSAGVPDGAYQTFHRGASLQTGQYERGARRGTWETRNPWGRVTHRSKYHETPDGWEATRGLPPQNAPGPKVAMGSWANPEQGDWPWPWSEAPHVAASFSLEVGNQDARHGNSDWEMAWKSALDGNGAAGFEVQWDVSGHAIQLRSRFAESEFALSLGLAALQRSLVIRPATRFGFPMPGSALVTIQQPPAASPQSD